MAYGFSGHKKINGLIIYFYYFLFLSQNKPSVILVGYIVIFFLKSPFVNMFVYVSLYTVYHSMKSIGLWKFSLSQEDSPGSRIMRLFNDHDGQRELGARVALKEKGPFKLKYSIDDGTR